MNDKNIIVGAIVLIIAVGAVLYAISGSPSSPTGAVSNLQDASSTVPASGPNLALAACLKDKGVVFYGAFWCAHCKSQKALFGDAVPALPYVECSTPDGNYQNQICKDNGINTYPTWRFPDGGELTGVQQLTTLAASSSCMTTTSSESSILDASAQSTSTATIEIPTPTSGGR